MGDNALGVLIGGSPFKLPRLDFPPHHRARAGAQYNSQLGSIVISESALIATLIAAAVLLTL